MQTFGATKKPLILLEERLDLICKRPSFPPTGTHLSPRSICLGMKIDQQPVKFIAINKQANSLYSLIADGNHRRTSLARDTWKSLIGSKASLQHNCNREGFNAKSDSEQVNSNKARIGILSNNENECQSCDSRIGFGTGGYPDDSNTCGNEALAMYEADNSDKHIKAMMYILVQWKVNNKKGNCHFWGITWFLEEQKGGSVKTLERFKGDYSNFLGQWRRWGGGDHESYQ